MLVEIQVHCKTWWTHKRRRWVFCCRTHAALNSSWSLIRNYTWWWQWRALDLSLTSKKRFLQIPEEYDLRTCTRLTWNIVMSALAPKWSLVCNFTLRCYVVSSFVFWYSEMKWLTNGWELFTSVTINVSDLSCLCCLSLNVTSICFICSVHRPLLILKSI